MKTLKVSTIQLYQLLISDLRYAYSRNNHLMPSCAFDEAKNLLTNMSDVDIETAIMTAKQLCEECISDQLATNFYYGLDDENQNRKESICFINWLLDFIHKEEKEYKPYNYGLYEVNLINETNLKFDIIKANSFDVDVEKLYSGYLTDLPELYHFEYLEKDLSNNNAIDNLFEKILNTNDSRYNKRNLIKNGKVVGALYKVITPKDHEDEIYGIILSKANYDKIIKE